MRNANFAYRGVEMAAYFAMEKHKQRNASDVTVAGSNDVK